MKRHTRHSREGFYPKKPTDSTLPGLLYVASEGPENVYVNEPQIEAEETKAIDGDKVVVKEGNLENLEGDSFPQGLWKSLWKRAFLKPQMAEIYGLVALCTHFVQTSFTRKTLYFSDGYVKKLCFS